MISTIYETSRNNLLNKKLFDLSNSLSKCYVATEEFLVNSYSDEAFYKNGQNSSTITYQSEYGIAQKILQESGQGNTFEGQSKTIDSIMYDMQEYHQIFGSIIQLNIDKGFKDLGIEGKMRTCIHNLENLSPPIEQRPILSLRRHEKDFLLRKDKSYVEKFDAEWHMLHQNLQNGNNDLKRRQYVSENLENYRFHFKEIVKITERIGLKYNLGLRHQLFQKQNDIEKKLYRLRKNIDLNTNASLQHLKSVVWIVTCLVMLFLGLLIVLYFVFNNMVRKPVAQLHEAAEMISSGYLSIDMSNLKKHSILQDLTNSIEKIIQKFKNTMDQAARLADTDSTTTIEASHPNDETSVILKQINDEFKIMRQKEQMRAWHNEGLAQFAMLGREHHSLEKFCDHALAFIIKFLKFNQGAFFVVSRQDASPVLHLKAKYAYGRKKYGTHTISPGEGLLGQAFQEGESIYLTDIPEGYTSITSGLGEATPKFIYIMVCKVKDQVEAIVEFASFRCIDHDELEYLEKCGENIASMIYSLRINEQTAQMMEAFKVQSEKLKAKEEEMQQHLEELYATQEEMRTKELNYLNRIKHLEDQPKVFFN